jgi:hypothetical protein
MYIPINKNNSKNLVHNRWKFQRLPYDQFWFDKLDHVFGIFANKNNQTEEQNQIYNLIKSRFCLPALNLSTYESTCNRKSFLANFIRIISE